MTSHMALSLVQDALWQALLISAPLLILTLIAGLAISVFQAVTQIHEMTMTFVPKILAVAAALIIFGHWMLRTLVNYTSGLFIKFPDFIK